MSVKDAAKRLGIGRPALSNFLNGKSALSPEMAVRLEKAFGADRKQRVIFDTEFGELHFGLDLCDREVATLRLRYILDLGAAYAELECGIAIAILGPMRHDLTAIELQHRDRHMFAPAGEDTGHAELLRDDT